MHHGIADPNKNILQHAYHWYSQISPVQSFYQLFFSNMSV